MRHLLKHKSLEILVTSCTKFIIICQKCLITAISFMFYSGMVLLSIIFLSISSKAFTKDFSDSYYVIGENDDVSEVAMKYDISVNELIYSNPNIEDFHNLKEGELLYLPLDRIPPNSEKEGIVINLAEPRLYYFPKKNDGKFQTFPIAVGSDQKTPQGKTYIARKKKDPYWIPPESIRQENLLLPKIVFSGPENPLGTRALYVEDKFDKKWENIMIHGTNNPSSIGFSVSHGCIRLYPQDIEKLFDLVDLKTAVTILNQPLKVAEIDDEVYLEVHLEDWEELEEEPDIRGFICSNIQDCNEKIDWQKAREVVKQNSGVPTIITKNYEFEQIEVEEN